MNAIKCLTARSILLLNILTIHSTIILVSDNALSGSFNQASSMERTRPNARKAQRDTVRSNLTQSSPFPQGDFAATDLAAQQYCRDITAGLSFAEVISIPPVFAYREETTNQSKIKPVQRYVPHPPAVSPFELPVISILAQRRGTIFAPTTPSQPKRHIRTPRPTEDVATPQTARQKLEEHLTRARNHNALPPVNLMKRDARNISAPRSV